MNTSLKAVILVAGRGRRLQPITDTTPKSLLLIGEKPILWYSISHLQNIGVTEMVFVVGYKAPMIKQFIHEFFPELKCTFVFNESYYSKNSIYSFYKARHTILRHRFLRLAGDLLYTEAILQRLVSSGRDIVSAVEPRVKESLEEFSIKVNQQTKKIITYGKQIPKDEAYGEAQGIDFISKDASEEVFKSLITIIKNRQTHEFPEYAFQHIIDSGGNVYYQDNDISDFWCEVDTEADIVYAKTNIQRILTVK